MFVLVQLSLRQPYVEYSNLIRRGFDFFKQTEIETEKLLKGYNRFEFGLLFELKDSPLFSLIVDSCVI